MPVKVPKADFPVPSDGGAGRWGRAGSGSNSRQRGGLGNAGLRVISVPMGPGIDRRDVKIPAGASIPSRAPKVVTSQAPIDLGKIVRQPTPSEQKVVQAEKTYSGWEPTGWDPTVKIISTKPKGGNVALDLGGLIGQLGGEYINARYGPNQGTQKYFEPVAYGPSNSPPAGGGYMDALGVPFVDVIPETSSKNAVWDPRANCGQGKWIRKNKRRRRRLATASDIKDLAALNAVTSGAQKNTWIATHPS